MKKLAIFFLFCLCFSSAFSQVTMDVNSDKLPSPQLPSPQLPAPPNELMKLNGCVVYSAQESAKGEVPFYLADKNNVEMAIGVFDVYRLGAYKRTLDIENIITEEVALGNRTTPLSEGGAMKGNSPVITDGAIAYLKYNLQNGSIVKGDYITISSDPGIGMKAIESGFTVGVALENGDATEKQGLLKIRVMVRYEKL